MLFRSKTWWKTDITDPDEREEFWKYLGLPGEPAAEAAPSLIKEALFKINRSDSIFSIQLLQDWLSLANLPGSDDPDFRINFPGTVSDKNWTLRLPEKLCRCQSEKWNPKPLNWSLKS